MTCLCWLPALAEQPNSKPNSESDEGEESEGKNPLDDVWNKLGELDRKKEERLAAQTPTPEPTPTPLPEDLVEAYNNLSEVPQHLRRLEQSIARGRQEITMTRRAAEQGQSQVERLIYQMHKQIKTFTRTELSWIDKMSKTVVARVKTHLGKVNVREKLLYQQESKLNECRSLYDRLVRNHQSDEDEARQVNAECAKVIAAVDKKVEQVHSDLEALHKQLTQTITQSKKQLNDTAVRAKTTRSESDNKLYQ